MTRTPAAEILIIAVGEIERAVGQASETDLCLVTACDPWTVRDVVAHCSGSMLRLVEDRSHRFTPEDNQGDVDERRPWPFSDVQAELTSTTRPTAGLIDAGGGRLDGLGLGVWVHAGDIREALGEPRPYAGPGLELGLPLLEERSRRADFSVAVRFDDRELMFGSGELKGTLLTNPGTFVRLTGGRSPQPGAYELSGAHPDELLLFN